jgi:glucokinase
MDKLYLGVDLGGTNIAAGIVSPDGTILKKKSIPTDLPKTDEELTERIAWLCVDLCREFGINISDVSCVGIGAPGPVDSETGEVIRAVNLGIFEPWPLGRRLGELLGIRVFVENDANSAVIAEAMAGCAAGMKDVVIVTLGTGVGGGAFIDGKIYAGFNHMGLEVGHMVIRKGGRLCNCGRRGCFERYASATALIRDTRKAMRKDTSSVLWNMSGGPDGVDARMPFEAAKAGDAIAVKVIDSYIESLAAGVVDLVNIFQPQVLCISGGISNQEQHLIDLLMPYVEREDIAAGAANRTQIKIAKFKNDAGIIGAALVGAYNDK